MHTFFSRSLRIIVFLPGMLQAMSNNQKPCEVIQQHCMNIKNPTMGNRCFQAMEKDKPEQSLPWQIVKQTAIGGIAGGLEVTCNQGLMTIKNRKQKKLPFTLKLSVLYKGYLGNAGSMGPTTAMQFSVNKLIKDSFSENGKKELSPIQRMLAAFAAGGVSGLVSSPTEKIILEQQAPGNKISWLQAYKKTIKMGGIPFLYKGLTPVVIRDGGFSVGYQVLGALMVELLHLEDQHTLVKAAAGGVPAGIVAGLATHPFDTASTRMKSMEKPTTMLRILTDMYKQGGIQEIYGGVVARSTRVCLAIMLLTYTTTKLETQFKNL